MYFKSFRSLDTSVMSNLNMNGKKGHKFGFKWLQMVTNGYKWLQMVTNDYK